VLGLRLGFCKYGYQSAFCTPQLEGYGSKCRAAILHLAVHFSDGSEMNVSSAPSGSWTATTALNPIQYDHLFNGEIRDATIGDPLWDTPQKADASAGWVPAVPFADAKLGAELTLLSMPPMAVTLESAPISVSKHEVPGPGSSAKCTGSCVCVAF